VHTASVMVRTSPDNSVAASVVVKSIAAPRR
jgi:hypothetical protein